MKSALALGAVLVALALIPRAQTRPASRVTRLVFVSGREIHDPYPGRAYATLH